MGAEPVKPRNISFPPGESTYREFFYRAYYPDGTTRDTEPRRMREVAKTPAEFVVNALQGVVAGKKRDGSRVVRMEREITVIAGEWTEASPQLVDVDKVAELATPQPDPNDYCQRARCGHARGFHVETPEGNHGLCQRCANPDKCSGFIAKTGPGPRLMVESAAFGEALVTCSDGYVRRATSANAQGQQHDFAGQAAADIPSGAKVTLRQGQWVNLDG